MQALLSTEFDSFGVLGLVAGSLSLAGLLLWRSRERQSGRLFPPGPKGWPIIGNMLQIPAYGAHMTFANWRGLYGDIIGMKVMGQPIIVLNSREAIYDLLVKRGAIYSDRPPMPVFTVWGKISWVIFARSYDEETQLRRRLLTQTMKKDSLETYEQHMHKEALELCRKIWAKPTEFFTLINRSTGASIMRVIYGHEAVGDYDPWLQMADNMNNSFRIVMSAVGTHPAEIFPILINLPPWVFSRQAAKDLAICRQASDDMLSKPYPMVKALVQANTAAPSMTRTLIEANMNPDGTVNNERAIREIMAESFSAGQDTMEGFIKTFILAMMVNPAVQNKAHDHIVAVIGEERLPSMADRSNLPYIEAVVKETMRWKSVVPLAVPHKSTKDDEYKGYFIPKGTMIIPNGHACFQDPVDYPDPDEFLPERFTDGIKIGPNAIDPRDFAFGYGRRVCPGRLLGEATLWINFATLLYIFEIRMPLDASGNNIYPNLVYRDSNAISGPLPFLCDFIPRSRHRLEMLEATAEAVRPDTSRKD